MPFQGKAKAIIQDEISTPASSPVKDAHINEEKSGHLQPAMTSDMVLSLVAPDFPPSEQSEKEATFPSAKTESKEKRKALDEPVGELISVLLLMLMEIFMQLSEECVHRVLGTMAKKPKKNIGEFYIVDECKIC